MTLPRAGGWTWRSGWLSLVPLLGYVAATSSCTSPPQEQGITAVWAVDESEKVRAEDLDHWARSDKRNGVWDGEQIHLFSARNEFVAFQLILEAAGPGAKGVRLTFDSLVSATGVIKNPGGRRDIFDFRGRRIELFVESYIDVRQRSDWWLATARPLPDALHMGRIPDALVPADTKGKFDHGASGMPFDIDAGSNQAVWVDIFVPPDQAPGEYHGQVNVSEDGHPPRAVQMALQVYGFILSDTTHLHTHMFWGSTAITARHGVDDDSPGYWKLFHNYAMMFHRHRLDLIDGRRTLETFTRKLAGYYTGSAYTPDRGYDGPGVAVGNQTYSIGTYDQPDDGWRSGFFPNTAESWQRAADAWETWFRANAPAVVRYKYLEDEPPYAHWPEVRHRAEWIQTSAGVGRFLGRMVTTRMGPELYGPVTFWMTGGHAGWKDSGGTTGYDITVAAARHAAGEQVGFYNGQRPSYGDPVAIDDFATDARVNPWIAWKYAADQYYLWETAYYADTKHDAWEKGVSGSIIYTGEDRKFPGENRGVPGPIVSIRLKNLRRGMQDYEYLWLARQAGIDTRAIVDAVVPAAFNDYRSGLLSSQSEQPAWADRGYVYELARKQLAERLEDAVRHGTITPRGSTALRTK